MNKNIKEVITIKKPIFMFPSAAWDDFSVYEEQVEDNLCFYYVSVEGYIYYPTLQDGINYLIEMKNAYHDFLKPHEHTSQTNEGHKDSIAYKTYDIEIHKYPEGIIMYLSAPVFTDAFDVYMWLNGVIEQLEGVEKNGIV